MEIQNEHEGKEIVDASNFLETIPPGQWRVTQGFAKDDPNAYKHCIISAPDIKVFCGNEACNGYRFFSARHAEAKPTGQVKTFFTYLCRNCGESQKLFALWIKIHDNAETADVIKLGEWPEFGSPTPSRVITLIGPDRDAFLKGRRSESQGLGIGAFSYYRRVVENQKNRILSEIIKVSTKIGATADMIQDLKAAENEIQFTKAIGAVKPGIPQSLLINGHNPLSLLHSALSEGLHAQTDEECLELATSIRVVLTDLADRLGQALKDEAELHQAINRLMKSKPNKNG